MRTFGFPFRQKVFFYFDYFTRKTVTNWFEVKRPRGKMFAYEMLYSALKIGNYNSILRCPFPDEYVETRFGRFRIRPRTADMSNVSPAFERRDIHFMLKLLHRLRKEEKKVLFLDIGADIGTFTVTVGNEFKSDNGLQITAFEPASSSYEVLKENVSLNGLKEKAMLFNFPLWSEDGTELDFSFNPDAPGSSGLLMEGSGFAVQKVSTRTIDSVLASKIQDFSAIVIKMDVEGAESEILKGARNVLGSGKEIYLLVEDFVKPSIIEYLKEAGAEFICKLTSYNSFWKFRSSP